MTIWNVSPIYYDDNKIRYTVLPYNFSGTVKEYLRHGNKGDYKLLVEFLLNSRLSEKSARKYADYKMKQHDIIW